jgi:hypothetical protein
LRTLRSKAFAIRNQDTPITCSGNREELRIGSSIIERSLRRSRHA